MIPFEKYGVHQPLNRRSGRYAKEGIALDVSTMAGHVGAAAAAPAPIQAPIEPHAHAAARLHGDDTTVPVPAEGRTITGCLWACGRDDRPFAGEAAPALPFHHSRDRRSAHPQAHPAGCRGILQADADAGFGGPHAATRAGGPLTEALGWAHGRRGFLGLADLARPSRIPAPLALEAARRIDAIRAQETAINGQSARRRLTWRQEHGLPLVTAFEDWLRHERPRLSRHAGVTKAMGCMLKRRPAFTRFLDDARIRLSGNAAERTLRGVALSRKSWLFRGSDRGGRRAAAMHTLTGTARLNNPDPRARRADLLERIADRPVRRLHGLPPCHWQPSTTTPSA